MFLNTLGSKAAARTRGGLTLIEILVVIAIVVTMAAILFPVVLSAKESGRQTKCLGNLRDIGAAVTLYISDWNEALPSTVGGAHFFLLNKYVKAPVYLTASGKVPRSVWQCPSIPPGSKSVVYDTFWRSNNCVPPWGRAQTINVGNSYVMNGDVCIIIHDDGTISPGHLTDFQMPSHMILLAEACYAAAGMYGMHDKVPCAVQPTVEGPGTVSGWCKHASPASANSSSVVHPYHNGNANFLFCDMHVKALNYVPPQQQWNAKYRPRSIGR